MTEDGKAILASGYPFKWLLNTKEYPYPPAHIHIALLSGLSLNGSRKFF
jgi:hypothetical protein